MSGRPGAHAEQASRIMANRTDYYAVLEVPRTADEKEIRRSYYKLSLKLHPDKNPGNAAAEEAYRVVNHCYETLTDANKRSLYDMYGEKGIEQFARYGEDMPAVADVLKFVAVYLAYLVVRRAALRSACGELVDVIFPTIAEARATTAAATARAESGGGGGSGGSGGSGKQKGEEVETGFEAQQTFAKANREAKRRTRKTLRAVFTLLSLLLCLLAGAHRFVHPFPFFGGSEESGGWTLGKDGVPLSASGQPLDRAAQLRVWQEALLHVKAPTPLAHSGSNTNNKSKKNPKRKFSKSTGEAPRTFYVHGSCLARAKTDEVLCCHAAYTGTGALEMEGVGGLNLSAVASASSSCAASTGEQGKRKAQKRRKSGKSSDGEDAFLVPVTRYGGNDADALVAFHALLTESCRQEASLVAASHDRFEETSQLKKKDPLAATAAMPAPARNKAVKHKYPLRRWRPKFSASYSVSRASELYQLPPLCARLQPVTDAE